MSKKLSWIPKSEKGKNPKKKPNKKVERLLPKRTERKIKKINSNTGRLEWWS